MLEIHSKAGECERCHFRSEAALLLDEEELSILEEGTVDVSMKKGERMMVEGFPHTHVIYIKKGYAKVHKKGPSGKDQILKIATPCSYLGIQSMMVGQVNSFSVTSISQLNACYINGHIFKELIYRNGAFASGVLRQICEDELLYFENFLNLHQKNNRGRLAGALIYFSEEFFKNKAFELPFSYVDLAALIGTTRESVNRVMREFNDNQLITFKKRQISVKNMEMLRKISETG